MIGGQAMLDNQKIAAFISERRKNLKMTQAYVAEKLQVSFQAVSKWENGTLPNVEMLVELAELLEVSVDEILAGKEKTMKISHTAGQEWTYPTQTPSKRKWPCIWKRKTVVC